MQRPLIAEEEYGESPVGQEAPDSCSKSNQQYGQPHPVVQGGPGGQHSRSCYRRKIAKKLAWIGGVLEHLPGITRKPQEIESEQQEEEATTEPAQDYRHEHGPIQEERNGDNTRRHDTGKIA